MADITEHSEVEPSHAASSPYLPLDNGRKQIRLLQLFAGRFGDELRGTLKVASLTSVPTYEALSYTWGPSTISPTPFVTIKGSSRTPLTDNLYNALRRLRHRFRSRLLWIDAICIDQSNVAERAMQVAIMGDIYYLAWRVCIWLGDCSDPSLACRIVLKMTPLWLLAYAHRRLRRAVPTFKDALIRNTVLRLPRTCWKTAACTFAERLVGALESCHPSWHTRLWVFQELNRAKQLVWRFGCVEKASHPQRFAEACRGAERFGRAYGHFQSCPLIRALATGIESISKQSWWDDRDEYEQGLSPNLLRNALATKQLASSDARDRVYALLSVSSPLEAKMVEISYQKRVLEVYAEATCASMVGSDTLDILCHVPVDQVRMDGLPSWAADFSDMPWISHVYHDQNSMDLATPPNIPTPVANLNFDKTALLLHIDVIPFDRISSSVSILKCRRERHRGSMQEERYETVALSSVRDLKVALLALYEPFEHKLLTERACNANTAYTGLERDWALLGT